jgi:hypothetical protein
MKEDAGAVMLKATEATGVGLDRLNLGVVALGYWACLEKVDTNLGGFDVV